MVLTASVLFPIVQQELARRPDLIPDLRGLFVLYVLPPRTLSNPIVAPASLASISFQQQQQKQQASSSSDSGMARSVTWYVLLRGKNVAPIISTKCPDVPELANHERHETDGVPKSTLPIDESIEYNEAMQQVHSVGVGADADLHASKPTNAVAVTNNLVKSSSPLFKLSLPVVHIMLDDSDLLTLCAGGINGHKLFSIGRLRVDGDLRLAVQLESVFKAAGGSQKTREFVSKIKNELRRIDSKSDSSDVLSNKSTWDEYDPLAASVAAKIAGERRGKKPSTAADDIDHDHGFFHNQNFHRSRI